MAVKTGSKTDSVERLVGSYHAWATNGASRVPAWLKDLREGGITRFGDLGFPNMKQEAWRFTSVAPIAEGAFALNTAFVSDGAFVHVPAKATIAEPIQLLFLSTGGKPVVTHPRNLVVLEREARASIVETYASLSQGTYWTNSVTEVVVGEAAR